MKKNFTHLRLLLMAMAFLLLGTFQSKGQTRIPMPSHNTAYSGLTRGFYFTTPIDMVITNLKMPTDASSTGLQAFEILQYSGTTITGTPTQLGYWNNVGATDSVDTNIFIPKGTLIGILGQRHTSTSTTPINSYGTGGNVSIDGNTVTLSRFGYQSTLATGASGGSNTISASSGSIGRVFVYWRHPKNGTNNAAVSALTKPLSFCPGNENIEVEIKNEGVNQIDSVLVNWAFGGSTQTPVMLNQTLDTSGGSGSVSRLLSLGTKNITKPTSLKVWTSLPNNANDTINDNDTLEITLRPAMKGTFTIGGASPDFTTINAATKALSSAGLCGSTVFEIRKGTYIEQITLSAIAGASSTNTVTFTSASGDSTDVAIEYAQTGSADNWVVGLNGASWIRFTHLTLRSTSTSSYSNVVTIESGSENNIFSNNQINAPTASSTSSNYSLVYSGSDQDNNNSFLNNSMTGGSYGFYWYGSGSTSLEEGTVLSGNVINTYYYGVRVYYQDAPQILSNHIEPSSPSSTYYGIYTGYSDNGVEIGNNKVIYPGSNGYGIYVYYCDGSSSLTGMVYNNFVSIGGTSTAYGLYNYYSSYVNYYHNSVNITSTGSYYGVYITGSSSSNLNYVNNNLSNPGGGYAFYVSSSYTSAIDRIDYNNYYSTGTNMAYYGSAVSTITDLQTASGMDANSVSMDPLYESSTDLSTYSASLNDLGTTLASVTSDINGKKRNTSTPDIGATEFTPRYDIEPIAVISPNTGCGLSKAETITIRFANRGLNLITGDTILLSYKVGSGSAVQELFILTTGLKLDDELNYTFNSKYDFSTTATYNLEINAASTKDGNSSNDILSHQLIHSPTITTLPYTVGWENGKESWFTEVIDGPDQWELGTPGQSSISSAHGGKNAWMTDLNNNHRDTLDITLNSPCFDLSKIDNPNLVFWLHLHSEANWDGLVLERSLDGGNKWLRVDSAIKTDFYNDTTSTLVLGAPMWSGDNGGWAQYSTIDKAAANQSSVRYRFRYAADLFTNDEGVAIDDFTLRDAPKADLGVIDIINPTNKVCGTANETISVLIKNFGINTQDSIPVSISLTGDISGKTLVDTFFGSITSGNIDTLHFRTALNTLAGGSLNMTAKTTFATDKELVNDSYFLGIDIQFAPNAPTASSIQNCGPGKIDVIASSPTSGITWFDAQTGGKFLGQGDTLNTTVNATTTYYAEAGKYLSFPIRLTEVELGGTDYIEVQNMGSQDFDATGYYVVVSDDYNLINDFNTTAWALGKFKGGEVQYQTDNSSDNYWGSNLFFNNGSNGWAMVIDTNGNIYDYVAWGWTASDITNQSVSLAFTTVNKTYSPGNEWSGNGVSSCASGTVTREGNSDDNDNSNFTCATATKGLMNSKLGSFSGCPSERTPVTVTILPVAKGMAVSSATPFNGIKGNGTISTPDTVCTGDTLTYQISPPTGYSNADFGTKWVINNIAVSDYFGNNPTGISTSAPTSSANASLQFISNSNDAGRTYTLTVDANIIGSSCNTTINGYIYVAPLPTTSFSANDACQGVATSFTNNSTSGSQSGISYAWDFGDNGVSNTKNPTHTYAKNGQYNAELVVTSFQGACAVSFSKTLNIHELPVAKFGTTNVCEGKSMSFADSSSIGSGSISSYNWDFGDNVLSNQNNPMHTYQNAGTYNVSLTVTSNMGCTNNVKLQSEVFTNPKANFAVSNACASDTLMFSNSTSYSGNGTMTYSWNFGDGTSSTKDQPSHHYSVADYYFTKMIATSSDGCIDSSSKAVQVYAVPVANFNFNNQCLGETTEFTNTSSINGGTIASYNWNLDGTTVSTKDAKTAYGTSGFRNVSLTVTSSKGCSDSMNKAIVIYDLPMVDFEAKDVCAIDTVKFVNNTSSSSSMVTYQWEMGNGYATATQSPAYLYPKTGIYSVNLEATTAEGCTDTISKEISVFAMPVANFTTSNACAKEIISISNNSTAAMGDSLTYAWTFGDGNTATNENPSQSYTAAGTYTISLTTSTQNMCASSTEQELEIYALPDASFAFGHMGKGRYNFAATNENLGSYSWNFGDGDTSLASKPEHKYASEGSYDVSLTTTNENGCSKTSTQSISVSTNLEIVNAANTLQVYPNPFVGKTNISYQLSNKAQVMLEVYDATGKRVASLVNTEQPSGEFNYVFNSQLSSGVFLVRLTIDGETQLQQIIENK